MSFDYPEENLQQTLRWRMKPANEARKLAKAEGRLFVIVTTTGFAARQNAYYSEWPRRYRRAFYYRQHQENKANATDKR